MHYISWFNRCFCNISYALPDTALSVYSLGDCAQFNRISGNLQVGHIYIIDREQGKDGVEHKRDSVIPACPVVLNSRPVPPDVC